jgi:hypothetical protein
MKEFELKSKVAVAKDILDEIEREYLDKGQPNKNEASS